MFRDRKDAGIELAKKLEKYKESDAVVLALPRGGVEVGFEIAQALKLPLDIVVTRKIGHPNNPEYAICAVDAHGTLLCNEAERKSVDEVWLKEKVEQQRSEAKRRIEVYRGGKKPVEIAGRIAIITDDGIATGLTMELSITAVKAQNPKRIIVAVPVAPPDVVERMKQDVDELIVLEPPEGFLGAVGAHYVNFNQVKDEEVIRLMKG